MIGTLTTAHTGGPGKRTWSNPGKALGSYLGGGEAEAPRAAVLELREQHLRLVVDGLVVDCINIGQAVADSGIGSTMYVVSASPGFRGIADSRHPGERR
ncbi:hypothetical protein GCM10007977_108520 [Dactylosporangium sucinum]|uniref:Uncharacterized protein n=1 Tax=Dactylosporangium sucinum TaxID=1424081 RepID=A0A917UI10_9ACTN|nr:hypothetical protein GCM10007977_108520 [Dactylosporangium sucinum]